MADATDTTQAAATADTTAPAAAPTDTTAPAAAPTDTTAPAAAPTDTTAPAAAPADATAEQSDSSTVVTVDTNPVTAQVPGPAPTAVGQVAVHETRVETDRVILDTSSPLAVQVPPTTGDEALTPIAKAYRDGKTANDKIAEEAAAEE